MNDFLTKPLVPEKIVTKLNEYLIKKEHSPQLMHNDTSENDLHMAYDELVNVFNEKIVKEVMIIALKDIPAKILELENACNRRDPESLSAAAHKIKGSSSSMRLGIMAKIAGKIEIESRDSWNDHLIVQVSELKAEWEIVKEIIQQKLN